jgi:hypothetical protein
LLVCFWNAEQSIRCDALQPADQLHGIAACDGCFIYGTDSGVCSSDPLDKAWRELNMPFCGSVVQYVACLPKYQVPRLLARV